jgi:hypothetical protein
MLFAHLKRILKLDRLRLRGPNGARDEFHLAAAAQNLRKLAKLIQRPALFPISAKIGVRTTASAHPLSQSNRPHRRLLTSSTESVKTRPLGGSRSQRLADELGLRVPFMHRSWPFAGPISHTNR